MVWKHFRWLLKVQIKKEEVKRKQGFTTLILSPFYIMDQIENLSSGRYLVCINSLSCRQSESWWKSSNLLLVKDYSWMMINVKVEKNNGNSDGDDGNPDANIEND